MKRSTPGRLACVDIAAFPLQLLLRRQPHWAKAPVAVVAQDKPQGMVLWVNEKARRQGVLPGLRYAAALSLAPGLRAGEVPPAEIKQGVDELTRGLIRFTPEVEPAVDEPGVFWLNGAGLKRLYGSPQKWAAAIYNYLRVQGFSGSLAVGFTRFGSYAAAKAEKHIAIFVHPTVERSAAMKVPLDRLNIEPEFRNMLGKLAVKTVGDLLSLPPAGLCERFGKEAYRLYRMAAGDLWTPLEPHAPDEPAIQKQILDDAEDNTTRLLFLIKQLLHPLLAMLVRRHQALVALWLSMQLDRNGRLEEQLRPAAPTLDEVQLLDLVRLRLETLEIAAGVVEIELRAETCAASSEQLRLFIEKPTRDLDAANRALARLRAEFGEESVVCARLGDGYLPEARFVWEPLSCIQLPAAGFNRSHHNGLVRRIQTKPRRLPGGPQPSHEDGWLLLGPKYGSIDKLTGPYVFSGGWWNRKIQREYYYAETRRGDLLWLYYDRVRRRWFLQGTIE